MGSASVLSDLEAILADHAEAHDDDEVRAECGITFGMVRDAVTLAALRRSAPAEIAALMAKAEEQVAYWRERQRAEKCLEDGVSEDGQTYMPIGDSAAWRGGYCNGRMCEADWWLKTIRAAALSSVVQRRHAYVPHPKYGFCNACGYPRSEKLLHTDESDQPPAPVQSRTEPA